MPGLLASPGILGGNSTLSAIDSYLDPRRNAILGFASGFAGGRTPGQGIAMGLQGAMQGRVADTAYATQQKADADRQKQLADAVAYLRRVAPDYADAVANGTMTPSDAFKQHLEDSKPKPAPAPIEVSQGSTLFDPVTRQPIFTAPKDAAGPAAPTGYRYGTSGNLEYIPGGPADPSTAGKTTEATRRNQQLATVIEPEVNALIGDATHPGTFDALANGWDQAKGMIPGGNVIGMTATSPEYQQATDSLKTIVASYLYSVSGATANPGEVANQVDVLTPKVGDSPERVAAKKARVIQMVNAVKAAATGTPIAIGGNQPPAGSTGGTTTSGLQWKVVQ